MPRLALRVPAVQSKASNSFWHYFLRSDKVTISANCRGHLMFTLQTSMVSVKTSFRDLHNPASRDAPAAATGVADASDFVHSLVDLKRFARFVAVQQSQGNMLLGE